MIEEYRQQVEETRLRHPGVERRRRTLDKTSRMLNDRLPKVLGHVRDDASAFVEKLLYGAQLHGPLKSAYQCGNFVLLSLVKEGAQVLSSIDAEALLSLLSDCPWEVENFLRWRNLYMETAAHDEALFVGVC